MAGIGGIAGFCGVDVPWDRALRCSTLPAGFGWQECRAAPGRVQLRSKHVRTRILLCRTETHCREGGFPGRSSAQISFFDGLRSWALRLRASPPSSRFLMAPAARRSTPSRASHAGDPPNRLVSFEIEFHELPAIHCCQNRCCHAARSAALQVGLGVANLAGSGL